MRIPERKQHQNRSASCYIFTTQSQPKIYTFGNEATGVDFSYGVAQALNFLVQVQIMFQSHM